MPQVRKTAGRKKFIISAAEARRFLDVTECLKYIGFARDKDDLLTANADKLASDLEAFADAIAKPLAKRAKAEQAQGGTTPLFEAPLLTGEPSASDGAANGSGADESKPAKSKRKEPAAS